MFDKVVSHEVWVDDDFLSESDLAYLEENYVNKDFDMIHVNNKDFKPIMADTDMSYRVVTMDIYQPIYDALNPIAVQEFGREMPNEKTSGLNMQYKRFEGNDFYAMHAEDRIKYGDMVYILYLTDEQDGDLVLPSINDAQSQWTQGFQEMTQQFEIKFAPETVSIKPKRNRCVVMRTGIAHCVRACTGRRDSIAGWPWFKKQ